MEELYIDECTHFYNKYYDDNIFENQYTKLDVLGSGAFGTVYKAIDNETNVTVAIKQIKKHNNYTSIMKEISILKSLHHPHIVKYESFIETNTYIYIIMEYLSGGTLRAYITQHKDELNENTARIITKQLLNAVEYLHLTCDICHRDIKPSNIMLSKENDISSIKLLDFGLSVDTFEYNRMIENCGTLIYMAPEQLKNCTIYYKSIDMWSVGIITYMLINKGEHPFYKTGDSTETIISSIKKCHIEYNMNIFSEMSKLFISKLIDKNEVNRYTAKLALIHPWITLNIQSEIPLNIYEQYAGNEYKRKMILMVIGVMVCKEVIRTKKGNEKCNDEYISNINEVEEEQKRRLIKKRERMFMNGKELEVIDEKEKKKEGNGSSVKGNMKSKKIVIEIRNKSKGSLNNSRNVKCEVVGDKHSNSVSRNNCRFKKKEDYLIWKKYQMKMEMNGGNGVMVKKKQLSQNKNGNKSLKNLNSSSYNIQNNNENVITQNYNNYHHMHQPSHSKYSLNKINMNPARKGRFLAPLHKK